jgi:esterase/lipase superfamily enzyme
MDHALISVPHFQRFLRVVMEKLGARTVHVIAHSMGNQLLSKALATFEPVSKAECATLRQVILAAPDLDIDEFKMLAKKFASQSERCTLYTSEHDAALKNSRRFRGKIFRAGEAQPSLLVGNGIDIIDATGRDTSLISLGHSRFAEDETIISDLFELVAHGFGPNQRRLKAVGNKSQTHWVFP